MYELIEQQRQRLDEAKRMAVKTGVNTELVDALCERVISDITERLRAQMKANFLREVSFRRCGVEYGEGDPIVEAFAKENGISDPAQIETLKQVSLDTIAFRDMVEQENGDEEDDD